MDLRYLYLEAQYRFPQNFTWQALTGASSARKNLLEQFALVQYFVAEKEPIDVAEHPLRKKFASFLADDLNIPGALSIVWEVVKEASLTGIEKYSLLLDFDKVLGLKLAEVPTFGSFFSLEEQQGIRQLLIDRENAKKNKDWAVADELRDRLTQQSVRIVDTPEGPVPLVEEKTMV